MTRVGRPELNLGCLKARSGYNYLGGGGGGGAIGRGIGELWSMKVVCREDSNLAWVNHKGDLVSMGGMGGMGGPVVS